MCARMCAHAHARLREDGAVCEVSVYPLSVFANFTTLKCAKHVVACTHTHAPHMNKTHLRAEQTHRVTK